MYAHMHLYVYVCMPSWISLPLKLNLSSFEKWFYFIACTFYGSWKITAANIFGRKHTALPQNAIPNLLSSHLQNLKFFWLSLWCAHFWSKTVVENLGNHSHQEGNKFLKKKSGTKNSFHTFKAHLLFYLGNQDRNISRMEMT